MMSVGFLLDSIDQGTVVLPEFQRGYVWSRNQVKGLIQSLYRRFPVGSLLIWNTRAGVTALRGSTASGSDNVKLLLDGQQRVTSLYGVIRGKPPEFFEDPERANAFTGLYFHLGRESFEFYAKTKMSGDPLWISVTELMLEGPEEITSRLSQTDGIDHKDVWRFVNRVQRLYGVRDVTFHDENISGTGMTVDVVVDIFNRVNSGGTKLSKGDLALARICAARPDARTEMRGTINRWRLGGFHLSLDWYLRCVNVVATGEARFVAMKDLSAGDFGVAMKKAEKAIDFLLNLVPTRLGLDHDRVLLGRYGFPAMVRFVVERGGWITDTATQNRLLFWYVHQGMWGRYSSSTESTLDRDLAALDQGGLDGLIAELGLSRETLRVRPEDFDTQTIGSRFYPVLYMLTRCNDSKDFCSGLPLSRHLLGKGSSLEVHHVFPKALLYEHGYLRRQVNAVANFAFLTGASNRVLGKRGPADYFVEVSGNHGGALNSQWIPEDRALWEIDRYLDFLEARRRLLSEAANSLLDGLRVGKLSLEVVGSGVGAVTDEPYDELKALSDWCASLGLARPDISGEIVNDETGEPLVYPDAAWPEGMQRGLGEKIALLLEEDEETKSRLGEIGYRFFTSRQALEHYVEELLNVDLDGDGVIGPVLNEPGAENAEAPSDALGSETDVSAPSSIAPPAPTSTNLEGKFHQAMVRVYERARDEANYNARYFIQMVSESGGLGAAQRLLASSAPAHGFTSLWEAGRLDLSVEATVLRPEYSSLFSHQELRVARRRLGEYGFEPD